MAVSDVLCLLLGWEPAKQTAIKLNDANNVETENTVLRSVLK